MQTKRAVVQIEEYCYVCGRVPWGNWQYLGKGRSDQYGKWRHEECAPGTRTWAENTPVTPRGTIGYIFHKYIERLEGT